MVLSKDQLELHTSDLELDTILMLCQKKKKKEAIFHSISNFSVLSTVKI